MLKLIWLILDLVLILIILTRTPNNTGLTSFTLKNDILGSPSSTEKFLNSLTWILISLYILILSFQTTKEKALDYLSTGAFFISLIISGKSLIRKCQYSLKDFASRFLNDFFNTFKSEYGTTPSFLLW